MSDTYLLPPESAPATSTAKPSGPHTPMMTQYCRTRMDKAQEYFVFFGGELAAVLYSPIGKR